MKYLFSILIFLLQLIFISSVDAQTTSIPGACTPSGSSTPNQACVTAMTLCGTTIPTNATLRATWDRCRTNAIRTTIGGITTPSNPVTSTRPTARPTAASRTQTAAPRSNLLPRARSTATPRPSISPTPTPILLPTPTPQGGTEQTVGIIAIQGVKVNPQQQHINNNAVIRARSSSGIEQSTAGQYYLTASPGSVTVSSEVPTSYSVSYSHCLIPGTGVDLTECHRQAGWREGSSFTFNLQSGYADVWWRYTPVAQAGNTQTEQDITVGIVPGTTPPIVGQNDAIVPQTSLARITGARVNPENLTIDNGAIISSSAGGNSPDSAGAFYVFTTPRSADVTISSTVPDGYNVSYSICSFPLNLTTTVDPSCHTVWHQGSKVENLNLLESDADIYWKYTPVVGYNATQVNPEPGSSTQKTVTKITLISGAVTREFTEEQFNELTSGYQFTLPGDPNQAQPIPFAIEITYSDGSTRNPPLSYIFHYTPKTSATPPVEGGTPIEPGAPTGPENGSLCSWGTGKWCNQICISLWEECLADSREPGTGGTPQAAACTHIADDSENEFHDFQGCIRCNPPMSRYGCDSNPNITHDYYDPSCTSSDLCSSNGAGNQNLCDPNVNPDNFNSSFRCVGCNRAQYACDYNSSITHIFEPDYACESSCPPPPQPPDPYEPDPYEPDPTE